MMKKLYDIPVTALAVSVMIAVAFAMAFAAPAAAQTGARTAKAVKNLNRKLQSEITLSVSTGVDNSYFEGRIVPVSVTVNNGTDKPFAGEIILQPYYRSTFRILNVSASPLTSVTHTIHVRIGKYSSTMKAYLVDSSNAMIQEASSQITKKNSYHHHVLTISEGSSYYVHLKGITIEQKSKKKSEYDYSYKEGDPGIVDITPIKASEAFRNALCYEPYSLVIVNDADLSLLAPEQEAALLDFAAAGGNIIFSYGGYASRLTASKLAGSLPVNIKGTEVFDGAEFYKAAGMKTGGDESVTAYSGTSVPLTVSEPSEGAAVTLSMSRNGEDFPLIAYKGYGRGMIYFTAFDISQVDVSRVKFFLDNVAGLLKKASTEGEASTAKMADTLSTFASAFNTMIVNPPPPEGIVLILVIFTLIIGPVYYFRVRQNVTMAKLVWAPLVTSAVAFASFSVFDFDYMLGKTEVHEFGFQMIDNPAAATSSMMAVSILQPPLSKGRYDVDTSAATVFDDGRDGGGGDDELQFDDDMAKLAYPRNGVTLSRYVITRAGKMTGRFTTSGIKPLEGEKEPDAGDDEHPVRRRVKNGMTITNDSDVNLESCYVLVGSQMLKGSTLRSGERIIIPPAGTQPQGASFVTGGARDVIEGLMKKHVESYDGKERGSSGSYYYGSGGAQFIETVASLAADMARNSPVIIGFSKSRDALGPHVRASECNVTGLGTIVIIKL